MRFAFVTTEFPTTLTNIGGLSTYVTRMAKQLTISGHEVEVFVPGGRRSHTINYDGYTVHHVPGPSRVSRAVAAMLAAVGLSGPAIRQRLTGQARCIARAVEAAQTKKPFDVVHSADHKGIGSHISLRKDRLFVVRCSAASDLYFASDQQFDQASKTTTSIRDACVARADFAFAPSQLIATHMAKKLNREIAVIRPPAFLEKLPVADPPAWLPDRFLLHFAGYLIGRKGSDLTAEALALAWQEEPDLRMVWAGRVNFDQVPALLKPLGNKAHQVLLLYPQKKEVIYSIIQKAVCVVLPSRIDNLPNTVIESLLLGAPVIGSTESSIEELVEPGVTGDLVENGSAKALAAAMVKAWRGGFESGGATGRSVNWLETRLGLEFRPDAAEAEYLRQISLARRG